MAAAGHLTAHGAMLALAREQRGLTQAELSTEMSRLEGTVVSQGYISRAEAGRTFVTGERLESFALALGYPPATLCIDPDLNGIGIGLVHHRKKASLGAPGLRRIHAELALARLQVSGLISVADKAQDIRFRRVEVSALDTASDAAAQVRRDWNVPAGPVGYLVQLIEEAGGLVVVRDLKTRELDAVSQWPHGEAPLFLINSEAPADRFRFSLAHELGHVVMHGEPGDAKEQERQADEFASEFLMPANDIRDDMAGKVDLNRLFELKQRWRTSMASLARRALALGEVSEWQYRNLMIEMSTLGYRGQEPGDLHSESPDRFCDLVADLTSNHGYDVKALADLAGLLPSEFNALYGPAPISAKASDRPGQSPR